MRLILTAALAAIATAAVAAEPTTLQNVTAHGIVMKAYGMEIPVTYTPDGRFSAMAPGSAVSGTWRIDGDQLCTKLPPAPEETCAAYPAGKRSGDTFDVPGAMGPQMGVVSIHIN